MHVNNLFVILSKSEYGRYLGCAVRISVDRQRAKGEKLPVCLPGGEPVAKQLVIDRSRRRNERQRACREFTFGLSCSPWSQWAKTRVLYNSTATDLDEEVQHTGKTDTIIQEVQFNSIPFKLYYHMFHRQCHTVQ